MPAAGASSARRCRRTPACISTSSRDARPSSGRSLGTVASSARTVPRNARHDSGPSPVYSQQHAHIGPKVRRDHRAQFACAAARSSALLRHRPALRRPDANVNAVRPDYRSNFHHTRLRYFSVLRRSGNRCTRPEYAPFGRRERLVRRWVRRVDIRPDRPAAPALSTSPSLASPGRSTP